MISDSDEVVRQLCGELALAALRYLRRTGFLADPVMQGAFYVKVDPSKLTRPKFIAGASIDTMGLPFIAIKPGLNPARPDLLAEVIAHESIHIAQIMKGDLDPRTGYSVWKGKEYNNLLGDDPEYVDQPWEAEARDLGSAVLAYLMDVLAPYFDR